MTTQHMARCGSAVGFGHVGLGCIQRNVNAVRSLGPLLQAVAGQSMSSVLRAANISNGPRTSFPRRTFTAPGPEPGLVHPCNRRMCDLKWINHVPEGFSSRHTLVSVLCVCRGGWTA